MSKQVPKFVIPHISGDILLHDADLVQSSCDAVPDDQPNDIHINFFNTGYTKGRLDLLKELKEQSIKVLEFNRTGELTAVKDLIIQAVPLSVLEAKEKELNNEL